MQAPKRFWVQNSDKDMILVDSDWRVYATLVQTPGLVQRQDMVGRCMGTEYTLTYIMEDGTVFEGKFYSTSQKVRAIRIAEEKAISPTNQLFYHRIA